VPEWIFMPDFSCGSDQRAGFTTGSGVAALRLEKSGQLAATRHMKAQNIPLLDSQKTIDPVF